MQYITSRNDRSLFDATVLSLQVESCEDMMQPIAALKSNCIYLMQSDAIHAITTIKTILGCNVSAPIVIHIM